MTVLFHIGCSRLSSHLSTVAATDLGAAAVLVFRGIRQSRDLNTNDDEQSDQVIVTKPQAEDTREKAA